MVGIFHSSVASAPVSQPSFLGDIEGSGSSLGSFLPVSMPGSSFFSESSQVFTVELSVVRKTGSSGSDQRSVSSLTVFSPVFSPSGGSLSEGECVSSQSSSVSLEMSLSPNSEFSVILGSSSFENLDKVSVSLLMSPVIFSVVLVPSSVVLFVLDSIDSVSFSDESSPSGSSSSCSSVVSGSQSCGQFSPLSSHLSFSSVKEKVSSSDGSSVGSVLLSDSSVVSTSSLSVRFLPFSSKDSESSIMRFSHSDGLLVPVISEISNMLSVSSVSSFDKSSPLSQFLFDSESVECDSSSVSLQVSASETSDALEVRFSVISDSLDIGNSEFVGINSEFLVDLSQVMNPSSVNFVSGDSGVLMEGSPSSQP